MGKQSIPVSYRRTFDFVACAGGLGTNLLPARCFDDMLMACKPGGHIVFTVSQKHLREDDQFGMDYLKAINRHIESGAWTPLLH